MIFLLQGGGWGSLQSQWASSGFPHRNLRAALTLPNPGKGSICAFLLFCRAGWGWGSSGNRLGEARRAPIFPPNPDRVSRPRDSGRVRARLEAHTLSGASPFFIKG
jgi:hypothetical protein